MQVIMENPLKPVDVIKVRNHRLLHSCNSQQHYVVQHQQDKQNQQNQVEQQQQWGDMIDPLKIVLDGVIGRGTFGVVRKGSYNGQTVAVKVLDLSDKKITKVQKGIMKDDFIKEAGLWQNLDHPNITKMIGATMSLKTDSGHKKKKTIAESYFCIVSEYLKGGSLRSYLTKKQNKKLPIKSVILFALDIAKGLSYLHSKKIIHCDVKPENMLIDKHHTIKLADFGESVFVKPSQLILIGSQRGTLGYMAPEVMSKKPYGPKCDVYAFGICLWEIYHCDMAYTYDLENIPSEIYNNMRPSISVDCPKWLAQLMERCWNTDPRKRPEMKNVVIELEEIQKSKESQTMSGNRQAVFGFSCFRGHE